MSKELPLVEIEVMTDVHGDSIDFLNSVLDEALGHAISEYETEEDEVAPSRENFVLRQSAPMGTAAVITLVAKGFIGGAAGVAGKKTVEAIWSLAARYIAKKYRRDVKLLEPPKEDASAQPAEPSPTSGKG